MSSKTENLIQVKRALSAKYARLAKVAKSQTKKAKFMRESLRYERQAKSISAAAAAAAAS